MAQTQATKALFTACEQGSEKFSFIAESVGKYVENINATTSINSIERKKAVEKIHKMEEDFTDKWYEYSKKSMKTNEESKIIEPMLFSFFWEMKIFTISLAHQIPLESPGKSQLTYQRMIEDRCKSLGKVP